MLRRLVNNFIQMIAKESRKRSAVEDGLLSAEATDGPEVVKKERRPKKTKYAMLLSYQGHEYFGMQVQNDNREFPTIESHLLDALLKHNFITEELRREPFKFYFQRCARTDRRVSAVRQIVSMELTRNDTLVRDGPALLNDALPDDIRVFGIKRTTPLFHAQKFCDGRTYSYTTPTFAFAACDEVTSHAYRISAERIGQVNDLLSVFIGTHNYFNYTARLEHMDQRCKRFVHSFKCDKPFLYMDTFHNREMEFITLYVHGQSFIMHQIRKMIGAVICIMRGFMYKSDITRSFLPHRMDIPRAPGLGLLLEKVHFDNYEKRFGNSHGSLTHWGDETETAILDARDRLIVQRILREECETQSMMGWLSTLSAHQFIVDPEDDKGVNTSPRIVLPGAICADEEEEEGNDADTDAAVDDGDDNINNNNNGIADDDNDNADLTGEESSTRGQGGIVADELGGMEQHQQQEEEREMERKIVAK